MFEPNLFLNFLSPSPNSWIIRARKQSKLRVNLGSKNFNLNIILTCNIDIKGIFHPHLKMKLMLVSK